MRDQCGEISGFCTRIVILLLFKLDQGATDYWRKVRSEDSVSTTFQRFDAIARSLIGFAEGADNLTNAARLPLSEDRIAPHRRHQVRRKRSIDVRPKNIRNTISDFKYPVSIDITLGYFLIDCSFETNRSASSFQFRLCAITVCTSQARIGGRIR